MELEKALSKTIQTLIDSGGEPWEYDSMAIQELVNHIEKHVPKTYKSLDGVTEAVEPKGYSEWCCDERSVHHIGYDSFVAYEKALENPYTADEMIENCRKRIESLEKEAEWQLNERKGLYDKLQTANAKIKEQGEVIENSDNFWYNEFNDKYPDEVAKLLSQPKTTNPNDGNG